MMPNMDFEKNTDNTQNFRPRYGNKQTKSFSHTYRPFCCGLPKTYVEPKDRAEPELIPVKFRTRREHFGSPLSSPCAPIRRNQIGSYNGNREVLFTSPQSKDVHALHTHTKVSRMGPDVHTSQAKGQIHPDSPREGLAQKQIEEVGDKILNEGKVESLSEKILTHPEGIDDLKNKNVPSCKNCISCV